MSPSHQPLRDPKGHLRIEHGPQYLVLDQEEGVTTDKPADLIAVLDAIHDEWNKYPDHPEFKNLKVGLFGSLAAAEPSDLDDPSAVDDWNARTDALAPVAKAVDFVVPVLYANTTNVSDFAASMSTLIRQARRFGKPVYAYIWPEYFEQIQEMPPNELIGRQMWQMILDETRSEADAGIMWGGIHRFDARAPSGAHHCGLSQATRAAGPRGARRVCRRSGRTSPALAGGRIDLARAHRTLARQRRSLAGHRHHRARRRSLRRSRLSRWLLADLSHSSIQPVCCIAIRHEQRHQAGTRCVRGSTTPTGATRGIRGPRRWGR